MDRKTKIAEGKNLKLMLTGKNIAKLARDFSIPGGGSLVNQHIVGHRPISVESAIAYAKALNCSVVEISPRIAKKIEMAYSVDKNRGGNMRDQMEASGTSTKFTIPLLSWVQAGNFCESPEQLTSEGAEEMLPKPLSHTGKNTFALRVRGDSMDVPGGYCEGDIVYVDPDKTPSPGNDVLASTENGITLKRYKQDEEGAYLLQLNGNKIIRPVSEWRVCGVVIFSGRKR